jgi:hypothetical protein
MLSGMIREPADQPKTVDAIRDLQYITELNNITPSYAVKRRISLRNAFAGLADPYPRTPNYPYDTTYRTVEKRMTQDKDGIREFLRKGLPNRLSWTDAETQGSLIIPGATLLKSIHRSSTHWPDLL